MAERNTGSTKTARKAASETREACAMVAARIRIAVERAEQIQADERLVGLLAEAEKEALSAYAQAVDLDDALAGA